MIVVEEAKLKFLLRGRPVQVDVPREHRRGRIYAVALPDARSSICRAVVIDAWSPEPGTWRLTIRQHAQQDPLFLSADPGAGRGDYTLQPHKAAAGEPEVIDPEALERYVQEARNAHEDRKRASRRAKPRRDRLEALERAAEDGDQQAKRHLFVIDQRIEAHERGESRSQSG